jgi:outer membrane protein TolC
VTRASRLLPSLLLLAGCAVGPSTRAEGPAPAAARLQDSLTGRPAREFLDSLALVRAPQPGDSGAALRVPKPLALDSTDDRPWLAVLDDSVLVGLVESAIANNRDLALARETYPRRNSFPEWFPVDDAAGYRVQELDSGEQRRVSGRELLAGLPVTLRRGTRRWRITRE